MLRSRSGTSFVGADIEPGLDRERHAGAERAPVALALVVAGVVHVEAEPVAGAVHVEALVGFFLKHRFKSDLARA